MAQSPRISARDVLRLPFDEFMRLPLPTEVDWTRSTLHMDAEIVRKVVRPITAYLTAEAFDTGYEDSGHHFDSVFFHLFAYYDHAATRILYEYADERAAVADLAQFLFGQDLDALVEKASQLATLREAGHDMAQTREFAACCWVGYSACLLMTAPLYLWPAALTPTARRRIRQEAFGFLQGLHTTGRDAQTDAQEAIAVLLTDSAFVMFERALDEEPASLVSEASPLFTRLLVTDLDPLARRDAELLDHYSVSIERAFEDQLELLFMSFGFGVLRARPGQERVDLLCVASSRRAFSFLVDAKSSRRGYALPTDDRRALEQYVEELFLSNLQGLAPLEFLLLVVGEPGKTLPDRLRRLGRRANAACHFVRASELARLRENVAGPLDPVEFRAMCIGESVEVTSSAIDNMIARTRSRETLQTTLSDLVHNSFTGR